MNMDDLSYLILSAIDGTATQWYFCLPGIVQKYDRDTRIAEVKPALNRKFQDGVIEHPSIPNVPVVMPSGGTARLRLPVAVGDTGMLLFAQRSLDIWLHKGGVVDPQDQRKFDLSDAIFVPGLAPFSADVPDDSGSDDSLALVNDEGFFELTSSGKFKIKRGTTELLSELSTSLSQINSALTAVATALGALGTSAILDVPTKTACTTAQAAVTSALALLAASQVKVDGIKG